MAIRFFLRILPRWSIYGGLDVCIVINDVKSSGNHALLYHFVFAHAYLQIHIITHAERIIKNFWPVA